MCGRFTVNVKKKDLEEEWNLAVPADYRPRYNVGPGQLVASILNRTPNEVKMTRWGYLSTRLSAPLINVRVESIDQKPFFAKALLKSRCIVPANSYFEWDKKSRQPYCFNMREHPIFAFASICFDGQNKLQQPEKQLAIITCNAFSHLSTIHDRMPVMLTQQQAKQWLICSDPAEYLDHVLELPKPAIQYYPVSGRVNSMANDDPSVLIEFRESLF